MLRCGCAWALLLVRVRVRVLTAVAMPQLAANPDAPLPLRVGVCLMMLTAEVAERSAVAPAFARLVGPTHLVPGVATYFHSTYIAAKKDCIVAPLIAVLCMVASATSPFPELRNCNGDGKLLAGAQMSYGAVALFGTALVLMEIVAPFVAWLIGGDIAIHHSRGARTAMFPPLTVQTGLSYVAEGSCTLFALGQALVLAGGVAAAGGGAVASGSA